MTVEDMPAVGTLSPAGAASLPPSPMKQTDPGGAPDPAPDPAPRSSGSPEAVLVVRDMVARLLAAWPTIDKATVEAAVWSAYDSFREARVRAYVPILAERRARKVLAAAGGAPSPGDDHHVGERS